MNRGFPHAVAVAVMALGLWAGAADSQSTRPARRAPPTTEPASRPAGQVFKIAQPTEFRRLAERARKLKAVYVQGAWIVSEAAAGKPQKELGRVNFEIWAEPPRARLKTAPPLGEIRLSDGAFVYTLRLPPGGSPRGRRQPLTQANYYQALEAAAILCDAANGYENLSGQARFIPVEHKTSNGEKLPALKWFRLDAATEPVHHLLRSAKLVLVGIDPTDGLVRTLVGRLETDGKETTVTMAFAKVRQGGIKAEDLKLPSAAAKAQWEDAGSQATIPAPREIVEPAKP